MTSLSNREFADDFERIFLIKKTLSKPRYKKPFIFLINHFNHNKQTVININMLMESCMIIERSAAHQILESFKILGLLTKHKHPSTNQVKYFQSNKELWDKMKKEVDDGAERKKG